MRTDACFSLKESKLDAVWLEVRKLRSPPGATGWVRRVGIKGSMQITYMLLKRLLLDNNNNKTCGKVFGFLEIFRTYMKGDHKLNMKATGNGTVDFLYYSHCGTWIQWGKGGRRRKNGLTVFKDHSKRCNYTKSNRRVVGELILIALTLDVLSINL